MADRVAGPDAARMDSGEGSRVLVVGAAGNLGSRLVSRGLAHRHRVTAFVRDAAGLLNAPVSPSSDRLRVIVGDAMDSDSLGAAMDGQDAVVNAAGHVADGRRFADLFASVVATADRRLPAHKRFWAIAGAAVLDIPGRGRNAIGLPGVPRLYDVHDMNWRLLRAGRLNWSLLCPGPMIPAPDGFVRSDLRTSVDVLPYDVPRWTAWAPDLALSLLLKRRLPETIVDYESAADVVMRDLAGGGDRTRRRVGLALPEGQRGRKPGWTVGRR